MQILFGSGREGEGARSTTRTWLFVAVCAALAASGDCFCTSFTPLGKNLALRSGRYTSPAVRTLSRPRNGPISMIASPPQQTGDEPTNIVEGPFKGEFGVWFVYEEDAFEVLTYRLSLLVAALSVAGGAALMSLPALTNAPPPPAMAFDVCGAMFLASFGVSLSTIHIYMKPLHNMLKVLWAAGVMGSAIVVAADPSHSLVVSTVTHPPLLLASGWVFIALTGLFFKEFACFQRWEASALFALVPIITGGHFLGIVPSGWEEGMVQALAVVFTFFAARKFSQPLKADIGDKTVFEFLAKREAEA
eukprot:CAMPEP_0181328664 /NCGR_PEP_ID=MMETSP1101-20121128/22859_1 /TAXON_ID=46948 /ORGANISM="Rhodomonas abbreviata, Strain Caron Lab Isolate" /LENGTH=303 /DNA_ID=CAMNT_0023437613 /DNA_START=56 /DNA_END=964 /DNA_ORIENTATION=+